VTPGTEQHVEGHGKKEESTYTREANKNQECLCNGKRFIDYNFYTNTVSASVRHNRDSETIRMTCLL